jgi:hypothetical protein
VTGHGPQPATLDDARSFTVDGPVQAEILVVVLDENQPALTGPCGPEPWYVEIPRGDDPMTVTARLLRANVGEPVVLHSTSWRSSRGGVLLTFVAVIDPAAVATLARIPIGRAELARGGTTTAPRRVDTGPVIEHGLRHLAWLVRDDPAVAQALPPRWHAVLNGYMPEPFRHL